MRIIEKIKAKQADVGGVRQPTVAFLGDSVTHGCFELFVENDKVETEYRMGKGYHEKVKSILQMLYPRTPVTMINAGISGDRANIGKDRLQRDVLSYNPDLVVVCYGLNDAMGCEKDLNDYTTALDKIFKDVKAADSDVIFMTPNLRTDKLDVKFYNETLDTCAEGVIENEKDGWLQTYLDGARKVAAENDVPVCDCNKIWLKLKENDVNINRLLSNRVNHPTEEMDWVFAYELVKMMFEM